MITNLKNTSPSVNPGNASLLRPGKPFACEPVDPEVFEQQCALLEQNEQAARRRAHENEYWRQRTLERRYQAEQYTQAGSVKQTQAAEDQTLEALDVKHRIGRILNIFMDEYNKLNPPRLFLDWVNSMSLKSQIKVIQKVANARGFEGAVRSDWLRAFRRGIRYMNAGERDSYQIHIKNGLLYQNGTVFSTDKMKSLHSGRGTAVFIQCANGTFYSSNHVSGRSLQADLASGSLVRCAGEWRVENGRIGWISRKCGFYTSTTEQLVSALEDLENLGVLIRAGVEETEAR